MRKKDLVSVLGVVLASLVSADGQTEHLGDASNATVENDLGAPVFVPPVDRSIEHDFEVVTSHEEILPDRVVTIHRVKKPDLPDPSSAPDPGETANPPETTSTPAPTFLTIASIRYSDSLTKLMWHCQGKACEGWSNVDFDLLEAVTAFQSHGVSYQCIVLHSRPEIPEGSPLPSHPELPSDDVAFVITEGDENDEEMVNAMMALHEVAVAEVDYLTNLAAQRQEYREDRAEWIENNPPQTNDVTINLWKNK